MHSVNVGRTSHQTVEMGYVSPSSLSSTSTECVMTVAQLISVMHAITIPEASNTSGRNIRRQGRQTMRFLIDFLLKLEILVV